MLGFAFRKNSTFEWNGKTFRVRELPPNDEVVIDAVETGAVLVVQRQRLLDEFVAGRLTGPSSHVEALAVPAFSRPLDELDTAVREEVARRLRYLRAIDARGSVVFTQDYLAPILAAAGEAMGDEKPPSVATVHRWHRRYVSAGHDVRSLVPRVDLRGRRTTTQSDQVLALLADAVADAYNASPLATGANIHARLLSKLAVENRARAGTDKLVEPSLRTTYRVLARTDAYDQVALREGKASADRRYRMSRAVVQPTAILQRVEADHTPLDLFVIDERTWLPLGRPTLTVLIDKFSRFIHGYYLSFAAPSAAAVVGALRHAILPKTLTTDALPKLRFEKDWPCYGRPMCLVVDNGLEFHGVDLEGIAVDLGITIVYCPKRTPRFKGAIERFLGTFNNSFAHQLPGTSFARFYQRGDYDPQVQAVITFGELKQLLEKWIVDVYAETVHRGIGTTPRAKWIEGAKVDPPELPCDLGLLKRRIGRNVMRKLRRTGVELNGIFYSNADLGSILRRCGEGVDVRVVYDPDDLGEVQVWGPDDENPIAVRAVDYAYANGLSVRQNDLIRQAAREAGASAQDIPGRDRARADLALEVQEMAVSRKQKARHRSAAIQGISSSKPTGQSQHLEVPGDRQAVARPVVKRPPLTEASALPSLLAAFGMPPAEVADEDQ